MLPNLVVIGAGSAGTTSLYHYLHLHPEVTMSKRKELQFFVPKNWGRGLAWYESQFDGMSTPARGEASPQYTTFPRRRDVAKRMSSVIPEAKLIYMVRDPIERTISEYVGRWGSRAIDRPIAEVITPFDDNNLVAKSKYFMQLEQYLAHYSFDQILVVQSEALMRDRRATLRAVFEFLGVDPHFFSRAFERGHGAKRELRRVQDDAPRWLPRDPRPKPTARIPWKIRARALRTIQRPWSKPVERPVLDPELRAELVEYLKPDIERLRELTEMELPGWST